MPRFVDIQPGGEKYLAFALSKLRQLKAWMLPAGLHSMSKHYWVNASDKIWIKAVNLGNDIWWDWIRIEAARGWDLYSQQVVPSGTTALYIGKTPGPPLRFIAPVPGTVTAIASFERAFALDRTDAQWFWTDAAGVRNRLLNGALDAVTTVTRITANNKSFGAQLGSNLVTPTVQVPVDLETTTVLHPITDNIYLTTWSQDFGGSSGVLRVYGTFEQGLVATVSSLELNPMLSSTMSDVLFAKYGSAGGTSITGPIFHSVKVGELGGFVRGGAFSSPSYPIPHARSIATKDTYYLFDVESVVEGDSGDGGDPDFNTVTVGVTKIRGAVADGQLAYDVSKVSPQVLTEPTFQGIGHHTRFDFLGVVATRSQGYAFVAIEEPAEFPPSGDDGIPIFNLLLFDGDGNVTVLDSNFPLLRESLTTIQPGIIAGSTLDVPWLALLHEPTLGANRQIRVYNATGLVYVGPVGQFDDVSALAPLRVAGNTRDKIFFRAPGALGEDFLIEGGSGITFNLNDHFSPLGGIDVTGITTRDTIYNIGAKIFSPTRVFHVTDVKDNLDSAPAAPRVVDYLPDPAAIIVSAAVPARSSMMKMQEFEAWAEQVPSP